VPKRNLTVQLDDDIIRRAKVTAAKRGTSVSGLVAQELERLADADERYEAAQRRAEAALGRTAARGGRHWNRDDLHHR
jgi:hypothetical protein